MRPLLNIWAQGMSCLGETINNEGIQLKTLEQYNLKYALDF